MTVFTPDKDKHMTIFLMQFFALLIAAGLFYIYYYNVVAGNRYAVRRLESDIAAAQEQNAELKNTLYEAIDPTQLEQVAAAQHLVLEGNPHYLSLNQWVSDSSY